MKKEETKIVDLYDLSHTQAADFLRQFTYPWEALAHIKEFILELGKTLPVFCLNTPRHFAFDGFCALSTDRKSTRLNSSHRT